MDALSPEWRCYRHYYPGDRVAFKIAGSLGVAAFECLQARKWSFLLMSYAGLSIEYSIIFP